MDSLMYGRTANAVGRHFRCVDTIKPKAESYVEAEAFCRLIQGLQLWKILLIKNFWPDNRIDFILINGSNVFLRTLTFSFSYIWLVSLFITPSYIFFLQCLKYTMFIISSDYIECLLHKYSTCLLYYSKSMRLFLFIEVHVLGFLQSQS